MEEKKKSKWLWSPKHILFFVLGAVLMVAVSYPFIISSFGLTDEPAPENFTTAQKWFFGIGLLLTFQGLPLKNLAIGLSESFKKFTGNSNSKNDENAA